MIYVLVLVTFYYIDGVHEEGSICQVREEDFDARFMKKLKSPYENIYSKTEVDELLNAKQNLLIEGTGIDIDEDDEISCTVEPSTVTVTQVQTTGTKIATIDVDGVDTDIYAPAASGGLDEDVIADEFDTTPTVTPNVYNQYDIVRYNDNGSYFYYWSKVNNNTSEPNTSNWNGHVSSIVQGVGQVDAYGIAFSTVDEKYYINKDSWGNWFDPTNVSSSFIEGSNKGNWSAGTSTYHQYSAGDFCMHEGGLYKCTGSTTGESWVAAKWSATQVTDELSGGGSSGGATVIEVWGTPAEPGAQYQLINSFADAQSQHLSVDFKVNGTNKNFNEVKALVEAGYCVLKTNKELSQIVTINATYSYVLVKCYINDYDKSCILTYGGSSWMTM